MHAERSFCLKASDGRVGVGGELFVRRVVPDGLGRKHRTELRAIHFRFLAGCLYCSGFLGDGPVSGFLGCSLVRHCRCCGETLHTDFRIMVKKKKLKKKKKRRKTTTKQKQTKTATTTKTSIPWMVWGERYISLEAARTFELGRSV